MNKFIIFHVDGGIGKNILATSVVEAIYKKFNPEYKIIVTTAWEEVWYHNPFVYRIYRFGNMPYFYQDYIHAETRIFRFDPYHSEDFIHRRKHLSEIWANLCETKMNGEENKITITAREGELVLNKIKPDKRKIFLIQTCGGSPNQETKQSWYRDMPLGQAQEIVNIMNSKGYRTLHIRRDDQYALKNTEQVSLSTREMLVLPMLSHRRLLIDSFAQHLCAALHLPSVVVWVGNSPKVFGYDIHRSITPKSEHKNILQKYSYLADHDITGPVSEDPFDTTNIFDVDEIIKALEP
jgi:hypothetical protein